MKRKLDGQVLEVNALRPMPHRPRACAGAHFWARAVRARARGADHAALLRDAICEAGKTDAADAEAICEAVTRPTMRFVPVKSAERQAALLDHKTRDFLVRQRTQLVNTIRAHLSEFGIVVAKGIHDVDRLLEASTELPEATRPAVDLLADQLRQTQEKIDDLTARIEAAHQDRPARAAPGDHPRRRAITASAIAATTPRGRHLPVGHGTTPPGSGSRHSRTRAAARNGWAGSPRLATDICAGCSTSAQWRRSARAAGADPARTGSGACCRKSP